jgi:carboxyl-terminal processing protease
MRINHKRQAIPSILLCAFPLVLAWFTVGPSSSVQAQGLSKVDLERGHAMLAKIKDELKKNYYDPTMHGVDIEARFKEHDEMIKKARSNGHIFAIIAQFMLGLNDSHTTFDPPRRQARFEYGWRMQMIGDTCYIVATKPGSDAEAKGVRPGDIIHKIADFQPTRSTMWKLEYMINRLAPQEALRLILQSPAGEPRELHVRTKVSEGMAVTDLTSPNVWFDLERKAQNIARFYRQRFQKIGEDAILWKMPSFDVTESEIDSAMGKVRGHKALVLDLRSNPGGSETSLLRLLGYFFEKDTKIADMTRRKEIKPLVAKSQRGRTFSGKVVVLVDSRSASAAEVFARIMQVEKRGIVLGDHTLGFVMRSRHYTYTDGIDRVVIYGASITDADVLMTDGKSLEGIGVTPDEIARPTATDLAAGRDPVLARAAEKLGVMLSPEAAGKLFPMEWPKDN